jgi:hypothetical protein
MGKKCIGVFSIDPPASMVYTFPRKCCVYIVTGGWSELQSASCPIWGYFYKFIDLNTTGNY